MSNYNPFVRGPFPAGVKTFEFKDESRNREVPTECWYPATDAYKGKDLDESSQDQFVLMPNLPKSRQAAVRDADAVSGKFPLIMFSHGFAGHRRQTTHFCTHLASHGYIVASVDHVGNTFQDIMKMTSEVQAGGKPPDVMEYLESVASNRPIDMSYTIDRVLEGEFGELSDSDQIGITGHSFGGWTTMYTIQEETRIKVALPLAPGGGRSKGWEGLVKDNNPLMERMIFDMKRPVPTLYLVADQDSLLPLESIKEMYSRTPDPKSLVVLNNADHFHFCDNVEQIHDMFRSIGGMTKGLDTENKFTAGNAMKDAKPSKELTSGKDAYTFLQGLGLAHMDAHLKDNADASALLDGDIKALFAEKSIEVDVIK